MLSARMAYNCTKSINEENKKKNEQKAKEICEETINRCILEWSKKGDYSFIYTLSEEEIKIIDFIKTYLYSFGYEVYDIHNEQLRIDWFGAGKC